MRLLDRYLLRELIVPFAYCLVGFLVFWISCDVLAQMSDYQKRGLKARDLIELYTVLAPGILVTILPIAFLLALLYALTSHAKHHELTAMRAAGISLARLSVPYVGVGLVLSLTVFAINEHWVSEGNDDAEEILTRHQGDKSAPDGKRQWESKLGYYNHLERRWWFVESYHLYTGEMIRPHVIWDRADGTRLEIIAERATYGSGGWTFTNLYRLTRVFGGGREPMQEQLSTVAIPEFSENPDQIRSEIKINRLRSFRLAKKTQLSIREILEYERLHPAGVSPGLRSVLDTKLHGQMASPWTSLVVVAIALPFGARSGRRNVAVGVASSIFICFAYFVFQQVSLALGVGGHIEPWVAAWAPNALFGIIGLVLCWQTR